VARLVVSFFPFYPLGPWAHGQYFTTLCPFSMRHAVHAKLSVVFVKEQNKKLKRLSEVGFEPTPSHEDQNLSLAP
jgi:hypothetical protein